MCDNHASYRHGDGAHQWFKALKCPVMVFSIQKFFYEQINLVTFDIGRFMNAVKITGSVVVISLEYS